MLKTSGKKKSDDTVLFHFWFLYRWAGLRPTNIFSVRAIVSGTTGLRMSCWNSPRGRLPGFLSPYPQRGWPESLG